MKSRKFAVKIPGIGLFGVAYEPQGEAEWYPGGMAFGTHLMARHLDSKGRLIDEYDLGSGAIPQMTVLAMASDYKLPNVSATRVSAIGLANNHISGTGVTAAASTDYKIQTGATVLASVLPQAGVQSYSWVATQTTTTTTYNSVATLTYNGTAAITEWALMTGVQNANAPPSTGTPSVSVTAGTPGTGTADVEASGTVTATPLTASSTTIRGQTLQILENTGATPGILLCTSNTTSVVTGPMWVSPTTGNQVAPTATGAIQWRDLMFDRKQFAAINVINGDSIAFTYQLTCTSGG